MAPLSESPPKDHVFSIDELRTGQEGKIRVMICRKWDVLTPKGKYLSTDFIVSDEKGNVIQCTTKSNVAHCFIKLEEGVIYYLKKFKVHPNPEEYRVLKDNDHLIEFEGSTIVTRTEAPPAAFNRYPFQLIDYEQLQPTNKKYLVDVIGRVTNVGKPTTPNGSQALDFDLINERGRRIRVTLWGRLGKELLTRKSHNPTVYAIILVSMQVKEYKNQLSLSSSSSTIIFDDASIPQLKEFIIQNKHTSEDATHAVQGSLLEAIEWSITYRCRLHITNVETRNSWYRFTCIGGKCWKSLSRFDGKFWCDSCEIIINYPTPRFRLQLEVDDPTGMATITMFDDTARKLLNTTAEKLLEEMNDEEDANVLPPAISSLVNRTLTLEIQSHTYYNEGTFESFTCSDVHLDQAAPDSGCNKEPSPEDQDLEQSPLKRLRKAISQSTIQPTSAPKKDKGILFEEESEAAVNTNSTAVEEST